MKLFIQQARKSSLKLQNLETLSSMSQDEMMDWSGGYGKTTCHHSQKGNYWHCQYRVRLEHMGPYGMVTSIETRCHTVPVGMYHSHAPVFRPPYLNPVKVTEKEVKNKIWVHGGGDHDHH